MRGEIEINLTTDLKDEYQDIENKEQEDIMYRLTHDIQLLIAETLREKGDQLKDKHYKIKTIDVWVTQKYPI